jgi:hypothetical protein
LVNLLIIICLHSTITVLEPFQYEMEIIG